MDSRRFEALAIAMGSALDRRAGMKASLAAVAATLAGFGLAAAGAGGGSSQGETAAGKGMGKGSGKGGGGDGR
ncbi:MAG: hypothetical protein ACKOWF_18845 [Chloroflexota bacterium]